MDRLARCLMTQEFLLAECRKRGLKVYSADQGQLIDMGGKWWRSDASFNSADSRRVGSMGENDAGSKACQGEGTSEGGYRAMWRQAALRLDETGEAYS